MQIRFDQGPRLQAAMGQEMLFAAPLRMIRADSVAEVPKALADLETVGRQGHWLAGYTSYELGYALEPSLVARLPVNRRLPLLCFGVFDPPTCVSRAKQSPHPHHSVQSSTAGLSELHPRWNFERYSGAYSEVNRAIGAGDIYQANLTFPIDAGVAGRSSDLYAALAARQQVGHGALVLQEGLPDLLSRSPELFFRTDAAGRIETRPMKGTQPRCADPVEDAQARAFLQQDAKNRAENLMIVDLLRNDISRIAELGSVSVPELFEVESYATVHQMVSTVQAQLRPGVGLGQILQALFPCGSITGAPKIRAMEILSDLEPWARDIYCGSIGWRAPDGSSEFNVAIRTLMVEEGRATLNVGGGVVWDSTAQSEYEEALWKARFAQLTPSPRMPISA
ncbi:aminodeoxychorismate synthase component I [Pseudophaeobacter profundi]|uniref:aminodeoxychorismate synthase component I n=1 Tax=Pseudophaeobacter profundi TaxID=3034152 RepID=UPI00242ECC77|nr:aminodeoxychorismate synthase component I [Pseudophaeobacter profundi]